MTLLEIRVRVSAVLLVRDGFTGRPVEKSSIRFWLDGFVVKPEYRMGGYFVFVNLEPGAHELVLEGSYFLAEKLSISAPESGYDERIVSLKPNARYPFGGSVTRLKLRVIDKSKPAAGECVLIAARSALEPKIAQDVAKSGDIGAKLFIRGDPEGLRLPGEFLIVDGKQSEACTLTAATDSIGVFKNPLLADHKRGKALYPCQTYRLDGQGEIMACFSEAGDIEIFHQGKKRLVSAMLAEGENELVVDLNASRAALARIDEDMDHDPANEDVDPDLAAQNADQNSIVKDQEE